MFLHGWIQQREAAVFDFTDCSATAPNGAGVCWHDIASGQQDELRWTGPIDAPERFTWDTSPPVLAVEV